MDFKRKQEDFLKKLGANAVIESQNQMSFLKDFRKEIKKGEWMKVREEEIGDFLLQLSGGLLNEQQKFDFGGEELGDEVISKLSEAIVEGKCS